MDIKLVALNARYLHSCPALFYVRAELARHFPDLRPEFLQLTINDPYYATLNRIAAGRPQAVFFSVYIWSGRYVARLLKDLRRILPETQLVLGGPQALFLFGGKAIPAGCTVVSGEIEGIDEDFYKDLAASELKPEYTCNEGRHFMSPYQEADFAGELRDRYIYYESSRGCPFSCSYCLSSVANRTRHKELSQVREELGRIFAQRPKVLRFVDRTFNDNLGRALELWRFLADAARGTLVHCEVAPDHFNEAIFSFLKSLEPGRFQFEIGVQSTNSEALTAVNRRMDIESALINIRRLAEFDNIHIHVDLILGLPFETRASFGVSFNAVFACLPHYIQMGLLKIIPGTPLASQVDDFGLVACADPPYEIMANRWLDHEDLAELYWFGEGVEAFFNNRFFRSIWRYLRDCGEDAFVFFQALLTVCRKHGFFELAPTQKFMTRLLWELAEERPDRDLLRELLVFDWLRSGQHLLPDFMAKNASESPKDRLWQSLPHNLDGFYDYRSRGEFFKKGVFRSFSGAVLFAAGLDCEGDFAADVVFFQEKEAGVFGFARAVLLPLPD